MGILDSVFVRRRALPRFSSLSERVRRRLNLACRELTEAETEMAEKLGAPRPPRLLMVDEEEAVIVFASERGELS